MVVYVVEVPDYDGVTIYGIYSIREKAEKLFEQIRQSTIVRGHLGVEIREVALDEEIEVF